MSAAELANRLSTATSVPGASDVEASRVVEVATRKVVIPYAAPRRFGDHVLTVGEHVYVRVELDNGLIGYGEAVSRPYIYGESMASITHAVADWFGPTLIGASPFDAARLWTQWKSVAGNHAAKASLNMALVDLQGQLLGLPVWAMLGAKGSQVALSWILLFADLDEVLREATTKADEGYRCFKVKISGDQGRDVALVQALSSALPNDCRLYGDANQGWRGGGVHRRLAELAEAGLSMLEDPLPASDLSNRRRLRSRSPLPVIADETVKTEEEVVEEITLDSSDALSIKVFRTGITGSGEIAGLASWFHRGLVVGGQGETKLGACVAGHFAASLATRSVLPAELATSSRLSFEPLKAGGEIVGGTLHLSDQPGFGIDLDEHALDEVGDGAGWTRLERQR